MKLVDNWKKCLTHAWSVRFAAMGFVMQGVDFIAQTGLLSVWNLMPAGAREVIPPHINQTISMVLFGASILARVVPQRKISGASS